MARAILVVNAGSSSVKLSVFADEEPPRLLARRRVDARLDHPGVIDDVLGWCRTAIGEHQLVAVGHRVVHGGTRFSQPISIDDASLTEMETLVALAPLHQPHNIAAIKAVAQAVPDVPQIACFDTAFHRTQPKVAQAYALPRRYTDEGILRYGFHGLSYEYIASVLPKIDARAAAGRTVVMHLGNGASMCALSAGRSVATTMGLTALDGLVMGTRCGAIDPGVLLHLMRGGMDVHALEHLLYEESGLLGVSGASSDMRELAERSDPASKEAIDLFVYRIARELGSLAAALGGLDAIVFTGGIGENDATIRERVCRDARWLGLELDAEQNTLGGPLIGTGAVSAWVIPTDEEAMIARHVQRLLS